MWRADAVIRRADEESRGGEGIQESGDLVVMTAAFELIGQDHPGEHDHIPSFALEVIALIITALRKEAEVIDHGTRWTLTSGESVGDVIRGRMERTRHRSGVVMSKKKKVGILTAGGDCPGLNAAIRGGR